MEKENEITRTSLRLPKGLYAKIDAAAAEHGLTMHAEILARLEQSFGAPATDPAGGIDLEERVEEIAARVVRKVREDDRIYRALSEIANRENKVRDNAAPVVENFLSNSFSMEVVMEVAMFLDTPVEKIPELRAFLTELDDRLHETK
jgi:hypothetical protein